jgi:hypothetical protein
MQKCPRHVKGIGSRRLLSAGHPIGRHLVLRDKNEEDENSINTGASAQNGTKCPLRHSSVTERGESTMTYDPNNANDPNRPLNPNLDLRTTPSARNNNTWVVWVAALAVIAVAAFAYSQWSTPGTSPDTTASTTQSEPAPAKPIAPTDNSATPAPAPAPATPPAAPAQQ